jgi:hypothetical protein
MPSLRLYFKPIISPKNTMIGSSAETVLECPPSVRQVQVLWLT